MTMARLQTPRRRSGHLGLGLGIYLLFALCSPAAAKPLAQPSISFRQSHQSGSSTASNFTFYSSMRRRDADDRHGFSRRESTAPDDDIDCGSQETAETCQLPCLWGSACFLGWEHDECSDLSESDCDSSELCVWYPPLADDPFYANGFCDYRSAPCTYKTETDCQADIRCYFDGGFCGEFYPPPACESKVDSCWANADCTTALLCFVNVNIEPECTEDDPQACVSLCEPNDQSASALYNEAVSCMRGGPSATAASSTPSTTAKADTSGAAPTTSTSSVDTPTPSTASKTERLSTSQRAATLTSTPVASTTAVTTTTASKSTSALLCGDGIVQSDEEECDDGNRDASTDGCDASCHVDNGYRCEGQPSVCTEIPTCPLQIWNTPDIQFDFELTDVILDSACAPYTGGISGRSCVPIGLRVNLEVTLSYSVSFSVVCPTLHGSLLSLGGEGSPLCFGEATALQMTEGEYSVTLPGPKVTATRLLSGLWQFISLVSDLYSLVDNVLNVLDTGDKFRQCIERLTQELPDSLCKAAEAAQEINACVELALGAFATSTQDAYESRSRRSAALLEPHGSHSPAHVPEIIQQTVTTTTSKQTRLSPHQRGRRLDSSVAFPPVVEVGSAAMARVNLNGSSRQVEAYGQMKRQESLVSLQNYYVDQLAICQGYVGLAAETEEGGCVCVGNVSTCDIWSKFTASTGAGTAGLCIPNICGKLVDVAKPSGIEAPWTLYIRVRAGDLLSNDDAAEKRRQLAALAGVSAEHIKVEDILPAYGGRAAGAAVFVVSVARPINESEAGGAAANVSGMVYDSQAILRLLKAGQSKDGDFYVTTDIAAAQGGQSGASSSALSIGAVIGIAVGGAVVVIALILLVVIHGKKKKNKIRTATAEFELNQYDGGH